MSDTDNAKRLFNAGLDCLDALDFAGAESGFREALGLLPGNASILTNLAVAQLRQDKFADAEHSAGQALATHAGNVEALLVMSNCRFHRRDHAGVIAACDRILAAEPGNVEAHNNRGLALAHFDRFQEALDASERAVALAPNYGEAHVTRGNALAGLGRPAEALQSYDRALALQPGLPAGWLGRGDVLLALQRHADALAAYDGAVARKPDLANGWLGRGNALVALDRPDEAMASYDRALAVEPGFAGARIGRGLVFCQRKRFDEALAEYQAALTLDAESAEAWQGHGNVRLEQGRHADALADYDNALARKPGLAEAWQGRGRALMETRRHEEAFVAFDKAFMLKPDLKGVEGYRLHCKQHICDWTDLDAEWAHLVAAIRAGHSASDPFTVCAGPSTAADQLECARLFTAENCPAPAERLWRGERTTHDRIRIAYISADFRDHAVSRLLAGLFERHDRARFETIAISLGPDDDSAMRARLKRTFTRFVDVDRMSDREAARTIRELEADIVVDLMGFTAAGRPDILTFRPAPIQATYLSYPGLIGGGHIDYLLADRFVVPDEHRSLFEPAVVRLPDSYLGYDTSQPIARTPVRAELGLPETGFVFCAYNNSFKLMPESFEIWMRLLQQVPGSVLWLAGSNAAAVRNLRREAAARGVDPQRLHFMSFVGGLAEHLARYRAADLFLDTLPFNAQTTACDALWAGLPVLTRLGEAFCGRAAASLLSAVGLPELIVQSAADYEALALKFAREPDRLAELKAKLARNRGTAPLFDVARFAGQVDAAFYGMWERWQQGQQPAHFDVARVQ